MITRFGLTLGLLTAQLTLASLYPGDGRAFSPSVTGAGCGVTSSDLIMAIICRPLRADLSTSRTEVDMFCGPRIGHYNLEVAGSCFKMINRVSNYCNLFSLDARVENLIADIPRLSQQARLKVEMEKMQEYIYTFVEVLPYTFGIFFIVRINIDSELAFYKKYFQFVGQVLTGGSSFPLNSLGFLTAEIPGYWYELWAEVGHQA